MVIVTIAFQRPFVPGVEPPSKSPTCIVAPETGVAVGVGEEPTDVAVGVFLPGRGLGVGVLVEEPGAVGVGEGGWVAPPRGVAVGVGVTAGGVGVGPVALGVGVTDVPPAGISSPVGKVSRISQAAA